jgi:hypothetical protein
VRRNIYYNIDHRHLFFFGFLFYFVTPYVVGTADFFAGYPGMDLYRSFFKQVPADKLRLYVLITAAWLPAFFSGHFFFSFFKPYKQPLFKYPATAVTNSLYLVGIALVLVLFAFAIVSRNSIFGGYGSYDIGARGKMSSLLVIFNFFLLYQLISVGRVSWILVGGTAIAAFLLLTMGGRMYVFQTFVIILVFKTSFAARRWNFLHIAGFAAVAFLAGGISGIWRMGVDVSYERILYSFFAEPVFTWFSTSTYLAHNDPLYVNLPLNFITSFFNLVPNSIISLQPYVVSTSAMVQGYESPLGADSLWTNLVINFGIVGSMAFLFVTGFLLNFLRHLSEKSRFAAVYYIMVCGIIPFQFFRDGFYILNKQLFFNFLLLPGFVLFVMHLLVQLQRPPAGKPQPVSGQA